MHGLEVPEIFSSRSFHRHQAVAEQVRALMVAAIAVEGWRAEGQIGDAALLVDRQHVPDIDAGTLLPAVTVPTVVEFLTRPRNGMEGPGQLAGADVPGAHVPGRAFGRGFLRPAADDGEILVNVGWR